jgi:hypothetical protein
MRVFANKLLVHHFRDGVVVWLCAWKFHKATLANSYSVEVSRSSSCLIFIILNLSNGSVKLIYGA